VLLHGWAGDRTFWREAGYLAALPDLQLVSLDLRGHGKSDKPHAPAAYRAEAVTSDVLAVTDALGIDRFAIWGLSYGGWIGWLTAHAAPDRIAALIVTGAWNPLPETWSEEWAAFDAAWLEPLRRRGTPGLLDAFSREERDAFLREPPAWARSMFLRCDPQALLAIQSRELIGEGIPSLDGFNVPTLLIAGELEDEADAAGDVAKTLAIGERLRLPGLGHGDACAAAALSIATVRAFLNRWYR
jgi:pimeloyl-ACP methyl ester carboxylesterase